MTTRHLLRVTRDAVVLALAVGATAVSCAYLYETLAPWRGLLDRLERGADGPVGASDHPPGWIIVLTGDGPACDDVAPQARPRGDGPAPTPAVMATAPSGGRRPRRRGSKQRAKARHRRTRQPMGDAKPTAGPRFPARSLGAAATDDSATAPSPAETRRLPLGSYSSGTLNTEDVLDTLLCYLEDVDPKLAEELRRVAETAGGEDDAAMHLLWCLDDVYDALNEHAPAFTSVGGHEGDPADIGCWIDDDALTEALETGVLLVSKTPLRVSPSERPGFALLYEAGGRFALDGTLEEPERLWRLHEDGRVTLEWEV